MLQVLVVNFNSNQYVESLFESLVCHTSGSFVYNICDNGSSSENIDKLNRFASGNTLVKTYFRRQTDELPSSRHHAAAIDLMIESLNSEDHALIIDVDCYMFKKDWMKFFEKVYDRTGSECICSVREMSDGESFNIKANPYLAYFKIANVRSKGISFMPDIEKTLKKIKGYDFGYQLDKLKIEPVSIECPAPSLKGLSKALVKKSMDLTYKGELLAQHMKMGGRGFKVEYFNEWLSRCKSLDKEINNV